MLKQFDLKSLTEARGLNFNTIYRRIVDQGLDIDTALNKPIRVTKRKYK